MFRALLSIFSLISLTLAQPTCLTRLSASDIISIAPDTVNCTSAAFPTECANATEAAPWINLGFHTFNIHNFGTQAALLSLMLYESGDFEYKINHYPGVPGQGTRNMQSPAFNLKYAEWLAANISDSGIAEAQVQAAEAKNATDVLALVNNDRWGFASAAWFLATQCNDSIREGLAGQTEEGWETYLTDCVGTTVTDDRTAIWKKAIAQGMW